MEDDMVFRKFGEADDQRVSLDHEKDELLRKSAAARAEWTPQDAEALKREVEEK